MSLLPDDVEVAERPGRGATAKLLAWNRRLHYYLGLYLLFFCWLFAFTGLLLNHPTWTFAQFWPNRVQTTSEHQIAIPDASSPLERARGVMRALDLSGEIQWPARQPSDDTLAFQVSRPGLIADVKVDPASGRATVQRIAVNGWGVVQVLHTFTGVRPGDAVNGRDWGLTTLWALSMDAVAAGLMAMVLSSYVMWYRLKTKRRAGAIALLLGVAACGAFVAGLGVWR